MFYDRRLFQTIDANMKSLAQDDVIRLSRAAERRLATSRFSSLL